MIVIRDYILDKYAFISNIVGYCMVNDNFKGCNRIYKNGECIISVDSENIESFISEVCKILPNDISIPFYYVEKNGLNYYCNLLVINGGMFVQEL